MRLLAHVLDYPPAIMSCAVRGSEEMGSFGARYATFGPGRRDGDRPRLASVKEETMEEAVFASVPRPREAAAPVFRGRYLSITSYKRDGTSVATPLWFVERDGRLLAETDAASGKVKRIRRNPAVLVAVCTASGRLRGEPRPGTAEILPESEVSAVRSLIMRKYRADMVIFRPLRFVQGVLHLGRPRTGPVILAITPG